MSNPPSFGDPDRMTSPNYVLDSELPRQRRRPPQQRRRQQDGLPDLPGRRRSTARRSRASTARDTGLTKTGTLYFDVIQGLTSGSDYADLADGPRAELPGPAWPAPPGSPRPTATNVHKADARDRAPHHADQRTAARRRAETPARPAPRCGCCSTARPARRQRSSLARRAWTRAPGPCPSRAPTATYAIGPTRAPARTSWFGLDTCHGAHPALTASSAVALPAGPAEPTCGSSTGGPARLRRLDVLRRRHRRGRRRRRRGRLRRRRAGLPWVNGPTTISSHGIPQAEGLRRRQPRLGRQPAGPVVVRRQRRVKPRFTMRSDSRRSATSAGSSTTSRVYTCDPSGDHGSDPEDHRQGQGGQEAHRQARGLDAWRADLQVPVVPREPRRSRAPPTRPTS